MVSKIFDTEGLALTLCNHLVKRASNLEDTSILHESGWEISAFIVEDYYEWINEFYAYHEDFGYVYGDFENVVYASSNDALDNFINLYPPEKWDYDEI